MCEPLAKKLFAKIHNHHGSVTVNVIKKQYPKFRASKPDNWQLLILKMLGYNARANKILAPSTSSDMTPSTSSDMTPSTTSDMTPSTSSMTSTPSTPMIVLEKFVSNLSNHDIYNSRIDHISGSCELYINKQHLAHIGYDRYSNEYFLRKKAWGATYLRSKSVDDLLPQILVIASKLAGVRAIEAPKSEDLSDLISNLPSDIDVEFKLGKARLSLNSEPLINIWRDGKTYFYLRPFSSFPQSTTDIDEVIKIVYKLRAIEAPKSEDLSDLISNLPSDIDVEFKQGKARLSLNSEPLIEAPKSEDLSDLISNLPSDIDVEFKQGKARLSLNSEPLINIWRDGKTYFYLHPFSSFPQSTTDIDEVIKIVYKQGKARLSLNSEPLIEAPKSEDLSDLISNLPSDIDVEFKLGKARLSLNSEPLINIWRDGKTYFYLHPFSSFPQSTTDIDEVIKIVYKQYLRYLQF